MYITNIINNHNKFIETTTAIIILINFKILILLNTLHNSNAIEHINIFTAKPRKMFCSNKPLIIGFPSVNPSFNAMNVDMQSKILRIINISVADFSHLFVLVKNI
jgi:hypothetical protein